MNSWLEKHRGADVEVLYLTDNNMFSDKGQLVDFGDGWIELLKDAGKRSSLTLLIPNTAIRIVKVHSPAPEPANVLLRPSSSVDPLTASERPTIEP